MKYTHQVEIKVISLQVTKRLVNGFLDVFGFMMCVP